MAAPQGTNESYAPYPRSHYVLTPEDWQTVLQALQDGHTITAAARSVGATRQAVYERIYRDPDFKLAVQHCNAEGTDFFEDLLREKALDPRTGFLANISILKKRDPASWRDDSTQGRFQPTVNIVINAPNPAQLREIIECEAVRVLPAGQEHSYDAPDST